MVAALMQLQRHERGIHVVRPCLSPEGRVGVGPEVLLEIVDNRGRAQN